MILREQLLSRCSKLLLQTSATRSIALASQRPRPEKKHYRLWAIPGDLVRTKDILVRQYTMRWHPGLNVGIQEDRWLYALRDGIMIITEEQFDPDWEHPLVKKVYTGRDEEQRAPGIMRYIHVIPRKRVSEFKLVDLV